MSNVTPIKLAKKRPVAAVKAEYNEALDEFSRRGQRLPCHDRAAEYADYDPRHRPTVEEAEAMCAGCPMKAGGNLCLEAGVAYRSDAAIWGGVAFIMGQPVLVEPSELLAA